MTIVDGEFDSQSEEEILNAMIADAKEYFGEDLNDGEQAIIRTFYRPIARRLAEAQQDIGLVLESSQIDNAEGMALDMLCALIGLRREFAKRATGVVTFSRSVAGDTDYAIKSGTTVQTDSSEPLRFETTKGVTLTEGDLTVDAPVEAAEGGAEYNIGPNTLTVMPDPPTGLSDVTNTADTGGGTNRENDEDLRTRAKEELAEGSRASAPAIINSVQSLDEVTSVAIEIYDAPGEDDGFELTIAGGNDQEIAQAILETKAVGDTSFGGNIGTLTTATGNLPNGQTHDINFSRPTETQIYASCTLSTTEDYAGATDVRDAIVDYIGGISSTGAEITGLGVGEDLVYGEIEFQIRTVTGVYDVDELYIGTDPNPTGESNIAISNTEVALGSATNGSIEVN